MNSAPPGSMTATRSPYSPSRISVVAVMAASSCTAVIGGCSPPRLLMPWMLGESKGVSGLGGGAPRDIQISCRDRRGRLIRMGRVTDRRPVVRVDGGRVIRRPDSLAVEEPLEIRV